MRKGLRHGLVLGLAACMAVTSLSGCGKKKLDTAKAVATLDGEEIPVGLANCVLRYQQAQFETVYGSWLKSYYGDDIWNADLSGTGTAYGDSFKSEVMTGLEKMLLAEKHMADYGVELSDDEKSAITAAAQEFVSANGEEVLNEMSATQENVERMLTLYTIQQKIEPAMSADVDTEVSDEEAAQRTVSYVRFNVKSEEETEADTEAAQTEAAETEAGTEETGNADGTEAEAPETAAETDTEEKASEASVTEAEAVKTESADETETEAVAKDTEAVTEAEADTEAASEEAEADTGAVTEDAEAETEAETEDEETKAAKVEAKARAEAFLAAAKEADDFTAAAAEVTESDADATTSSYTFGDDDTYPDAAIIEATKDLEDDTLVEEVIEVNDSYYVLHVDDAFDEDAVANKKEEIIQERKQEAIDALYQEWMDAAEFSVDEEVYAKLIFDVALTIETEAATEAETEEDSEAATEAVSEAVTEAGSEAATETEAVTEAGSEAATEAGSEEAVQTEAVTETEA